MGGQHAAARLNIVAIAILQILESHHRQALIDEAILAFKACNPHCFAQFGIARIIAGKLSGVLPSSGPAEGGTEVLLTGSRFDDTTRAFFGGRKLPELARSMGSSITQFRKGLKEAQDEVDDTKNLVEKDAPTSDSKE